MADQLMVLPAHVLASMDSRVKMRGHADRPGTGPDGETCGSCSSLYRNQMAKTYLKCLLTRAKWTGGGGTDVRLRDAACSKWTAKVKDESR